MAQPTPESERVTAFREPSQQRQTQLSDWIFRVVESNNPLLAVLQALQNSHKWVIAGKTFFSFSLRRAFLAAPWSASIFALAVAPPRKRAAGQAVVLFDPIRTPARRALRMTAALLGLVPVAALGGTPPNGPTAFFAGQQGTLGSGFNDPTGVAVDSAGNLFVADYGHSAVKEILAAGGYTTINTLAVANGNFNHPTGVAVDGSGNVFVADQYNNAVKEILAAGGYTTVSTLAVANGNFNYPTGVAVDASGNVFVADQLHSAVKEILVAGGYTTVNTLAAVNGHFNHPPGVAVDGSGNVFVADQGNNAVKEILAAGGYTTVNTLAVAKGNFSGPTGVAVDASDNVFVADFFNAEVKEILAAGGYTTVVTLGSGITEPYGVAVGAPGTIYVADYAATAIVKLQPGGVNFGAVNVKTTSSVLSLSFNFVTAGTGVTTAVSTQGAPGLDFADSTTGTCDTNGPTHSYAIGDSCTINVTFTPTLASIRYGAAVLKNSSGVVIATGYVYGAGLGPQVNFLPGTLSVVASRLALVYGATVDASGNVYIVEQGAGVVLKETLSSPGVYTSTTLGSGLSGPYSAAVDGAGNLYITDTNHSRVLKETPSGSGYTQSVVATPAPGYLTYPEGVAVDGSGNVYVSLTGPGSVVKETLSGGTYTETTIVTGLTEAAGMAVDASGNLYIASLAGQVLKETPSAGSYIQSVVASGLPTPAGVAVDGSGNVYIACVGDTQVLKETPADGSYTQSTLGSGFSGPNDVAVDGSGNLYILTGQEEVRKLDLLDPPSLTFAATSLGSTSSDSPQTVTLENVGTAALSFPVPSSATNPVISGSFSLNSSGDSACPLVDSGGSPGMLPAGDSCLLPFNFLPTIAGVNSGSLVLTDTNLNAVAATQTIVLSGSGIGAVASKLALTGVATTLAAGGDLGTINVSVETSSGSVVTTSTASITVTITGPGSYSQSVTGTAASGVASLNLTSLLLNTAGTYTVTTSSTELASASSTVVVTAGVASQLVTSAVPATVASGGNLGTLGVTFEDAFGNVVTTSSAMVTVTITGPGGYSHAVTGNAVNGVASMHLSSLVFTTAGTYTVTTTSGSLSSVHTFVIAAIATATATVAIAPASAVAHTAVTLTATVLSGGIPVHPGTVNFCNATAPFCDGPALLGTAQLNGSGIASFKFIPGPGTYSIEAAFSGTSSVAAATSAPQPVTIAAAAVFASTSAIATSGAPGNYTLAGAVSAFGIPVPTGTVSFLDAGNADAVVASAVLAPSTLAFGFTPAAGSPLAEPSYAENAVTGDFNNDGILDMAVLGYQATAVQIFLGKGDGTFQTPVSYNLYDYSNGGLAVADFNGDGKLDLVAASNHTVSVLLGNGDGTFQPEATYPVGPNVDYIAGGVAVGDFNNDGVPDISVVNTINSQVQSTVSILIGNGDGTFQPQVRYAAGYAPEWVTAGDFNGDGKLDLAICGGGTSPAMGVLLGNGDGSFQTPITYTIGSPSYFIQAADFNKDGKLDLLTEGNSSVDVFLGNGDGTFQTPVAYVAYSGAVIGDFNADGNLDLASTNADLSTIGILYGNGDGTFQPLRGSWAGGRSPAAIAPGDFNGDGLTDLFVTGAGDNTYSVLLNQQIETATATQVSIAGVGSHNVLAGYSGDTSRTASQSSTIALTGSAVTATSSILTVAPNPVVAGQSATFTLTISPAPTGTLLGSVSFYNGSTLLGTGTVNSSGVATFATTTLPLGTDSITASYSGNSTFASSTSTAITVQVNSANATATVTAITSSNLAPTYGQSVTLTATVTPAPSGTPPGTVSFYAGTTLLGAQALNAHGVATLSLSLPLGPNAITAAYSGSAGFAGSTSSALSVPARALSAIIFSASPTTQLATMPVVFTAQVSSATAGVQTGTVSFLNGSTVLATVAVVAGQPTVYSDTALSSGAYSVTASYSGDGSFLPGASTGAPISITVSDLDLALGSDNNKSVVPGGAVTYTFPLSPVVTSTFIYNVALTATGLPPGATYTFSPSTIPAGSGTLPVAFTVQTAKTTAMLHRSPEFSKSPWFAVLFGLLLPLAGAKRFRARLTTLPRMLLLLLFGGLGLGLTAGLGGCGSGGFLGSPPGQTSYTITISATSGALVRISTVQLNLE
jgi:DNA-binding beta-propeller fold protein YncE